MRGYLAVKVTKHQTTVSWVWDVFDQEEHRALRISGEETAKVRPRDAWAAADDAMLSRIARNSMEKLATFLTSPAVAPGISPPTSDLQVAMGEPQESSPEAAGIFRLFHPLADPVSTVAAEAATDDAEPVPLPPPAAEDCRGVGPRSPDACRFQPLIANLSFAQRLRDKALLVYCRAVPALL